ncbi:hypothetical protein LV79_002988 [Actinokineospora globicatena]|nr:hypothetical protein [Actinokineospora globicatena]
MPGPGRAAGCSPVAGEQCRPHPGFGSAGVPLPLPPLTIGMAWHPRHTADGAHDWLRATVRQVLRPDRATR